ncbi:8-oxoguanine DNA glycosylase [Jimgerdemannia flammicorona]|uniref:8-oxoguanine DNA glycosylase n=1 Tax=Jimgerdemannia flammicorona TaxID=994334 RepID=A0A433PN88_9FUNG|nr:8-oxoguanine DNA glycosylase [Jimgerdemannia flammicorona]
MQSSLHRSCALKGRLITLKQTPTSVFYRTYPLSPSPDASTVTTLDPDPEDLAVSTLLTDYFQLHVNLRDCYARWSEADANFARKAANLRGIRMLRQDPWENLVCFICSSNNNIQRISQMVMLIRFENRNAQSITSTILHRIETHHRPFPHPNQVHKLCVNYGPLTHTLDGHAYHDFPSLQRLATAPDVEATLRDLGFGYRAKYIAQTARRIYEHPEGEAWLHGLRKIEYKEAKEALLELAGLRLAIKTTSQ